MEDYRESFDLDFNQKLYFRKKWVLHFTFFRVKCSDFYSFAFIVIGLFTNYLTKIFVKSSSVYRCLHLGQLQQ